MRYALFADNKEKPTSFLVIRGAQVVNGNWYVRFLTSDLVIIDDKKHPDQADLVDFSWVKLKDLDPNDPRDYNEIIEDYRRTL